jgi:hypothetical protein
MGPGTAGAVQMGQESPGTMRRNGLMRLAVAK